MKRGWSRYRPGQASTRTGDSLRGPWPASIIGGWGNLCISARMGLHWPREGRGAMLGGVIAAVLVAVAVSATASAQDVKWPEIDFGRYHALVIGNNDYQHLRNLTTAVGDAEAVAKLLEERYGFRVTKRINATRRDIVATLNDLRYERVEDTLNLLHAFRNRN